MKVKVHILILTLFLLKTLIYTLFSQTDSDDVESTSTSNSTSPATRQMRLDEEQRDISKSSSFATDDFSLNEQS